MDKVYRVVFVKDYSLETFYTKANSKEEAKKHLLKKYSDIKESQIVEIQNLKEKKASASFISFDFTNYFKKVLSDKAIRAMVIVTLLITGAYFGAKKYGEYKRQKLAQEFFEERSQNDSNEILEGSEGDEGESEAKEDLKSANVAKHKHNQHNNPYEGLPEHNTKEVKYNENISQNKEIVKNNYSNNLSQQNSNQLNQGKISKIEKISYQMKEINATKCATKYVCIDVSLRYPVNIEIQGDKEVEAFIKNVVKQNVPKFDPNSIESYYRLLRISDAGGLPPSLYYNYTMKIIAHTDKTVSLMVSTDEYTGGAHNNGELKYINLSTDTFLEIKSLDEIVKSFKRKRFKKIAEHYFRLANNISKYTDLRKIGFYKNEFKLPEDFYLGKDGIHLVFDSYEVASWGANGAYKAEFVVPYSAVEDMIYLDKIFINYNKGEKSYDNSVNGIANSPEAEIDEKYESEMANVPLDTIKYNNINKQLSNDKISMDIKYKVKGERVYFKVAAINTFANAKGGISVSIPGVRFKSDILQVRGRGFNSAKVYPAGSTIWNGAMQSKMRARYVLIEGWAQNWQRGEQKVLEFSVDKSLINKKSVNIRAILVKNRQEYLLPTSGATDQQGYPVEQITVYANNLDSSINSKNSQNANSNGLFVCYDKKEITANGVKYIGCQRYSTPCNSNNKLHFGKYKNSSDAKDALNRCKNSKPKFIDSGKRASVSGGNYYFARISARDHYNKRGNKLTKVADILQQDRANFYKYGIRDSEDTPDNYFFKKENRFKIRRMLKNGYISGDTAYQIINGTPLVKVEIHKKYDYINVYLESSDKNSEARTVNYYAKAFSGRWIGTYICGQGITGLTLNIATTSSKMKALFNFYPIPQNHNSKSGSYTLTGQFFTDGSFRLKPNRWINRPSGYIMVGMEGKINLERNELVGVITYGNCSNFRLQKH